MSNNQGRLTSILKQETTALENLYSLLMKELVALKDRNSELISELSEEKNTMLNNIEQLDMDRQRCIQEEAPNESLTFTNEINSLSSEIEICLDKCKQQNSINGGIIEMSQLFNEKMLNIIFGNSDKEMTYSANGKNNSTNNRHSFARV